MRFEVARTRSLFERGRPLCDELPGQLGLELELVRLGGMAILSRIEQVDYDVFQRRPTLSAADKARIALQAAYGKLGRLLG
jgi:phytoene/squalene synthetase